MNQHSKNTRPAVHTEFQLMTGWYKRSIDVNQKIRLPRDWAPKAPQSWLLFPTEDAPYPKAKSFRLMQAEERVIRFILNESLTHDDCEPSIETALDALRLLAKKLDRAPGLVTVITVAPINSRITLTKAQVNWIGCRNRKLVLIGCGNSAYLNSTTTHTKWQREISQAPIHLSGLFVLKRTPDGTTPPPSAKK